MNKTHSIHPELMADMVRQGADVERTLKILSLLDTAVDANTEGSAASSSVTLPLEGDPRIMDLQNLTILRVPRRDLEEFFSRFHLPVRLLEQIETHRNEYQLTRKLLYKIGIFLYPYTAYGVLNGGSATTYGDSKKNQALSPSAYELLREDFFSQAEQCKNNPKGITSAYFEADGTAGPSFLLLKMRSLLIHALEYRLLSGDYSKPILPFFQMTSDSTDEKLYEAYEQYREAPLLAELIQETHVDPTKALSAKQGLIGALTHSSEGLPRRIFDRAYGIPNRGLALPGGHGENFRILAPIYRQLHEQGIRFVYLGNVDNSGYTIDPIELAYFALKHHCEGSEAAFEFAWRTPVDVKGGILVQDATGNFTVGEIGQRISSDQVQTEETKGAHVLFNCATGLFSLDYLLDNLDSIPDKLPIRVSDQDKEAGKYAQAEQTTWEILGLMKKPQIMAVKKNKRFIAAKMLLETFLASPRGIILDQADNVDAPIKETSRLLRSGLQKLLVEEYGFKQEYGHYKPRGLAELRDFIQF
ncbi:UTP--glucose-1-phosphate uridylyltransferase [Gracilinema caldarium]|uniref:UTP--glucose-1-phosphate uridylyltransferase n=1 Tax=Gracilinema caldarium (strain ATCC 51460 / DSM 7334 / H1) TaxID=744872 RepID=F8EYX2_GRAC1|nr:UTP--glucose-1-phosphate uridylyltransferase [Gracilinema caldarium]AEJ18918.1 hypothetical protein Spica_0764 [Gracilinema caldarium DSM 7334]